MRINAATTSDHPRRSVLFVTTTLSEGGAERFVATAASALDRKQFTVAIAALRPKIDYPIPADVDVHDLGKHTVWDGPGAIIRLRRLIGAGNFDVVVGALSTANQMLLPALFLPRRPVWVARVDIDLRLPDSDIGSTIKGAVGRRLLISALRRADLIVPNSRGSAEGVLEIIPGAARRLTVLPNPVDFASIDGMARQIGEIDSAKVERPVIITVARLESVKRLDIAIRAFAKLINNGASGHFFICGDGSQRAPLAQLASDLGVDNRVTFLGFVANPYAEMRAADIFVLSSDREGLPNALIEAQGLGLPAVATDCRSGPGEIIVHGRTGLLAPTGELDAFALALQALMFDANKRQIFGAAAAEWVRDRFALARQMTALEDILMSTKQR